MSLHVELDCPQCGAPLAMQETDRLLRCGYCSVNSYLSNTDSLHFILPRKEPDPYTIYAPYLHFKGVIYTCFNNRIEHRLADISTRGIKLSFLPATLGLRPQAMKIRFATPGLDGTFLKGSLPADIILKRAAKNLLARDEEILHQAFIGDVLNIIYLPLTIRDEAVIDGILERPLLQIPEDQDPFAESEIDQQRWAPKFLPSLCPQCGWNLEGEPDSTVLLCANCNSAWEAAGSRFTEVRVITTPKKNEAELYIPFWAIKVTSKGVKLDTLADFFRLTNQPVMIRDEWQEKDLRFVLPAFKIRPDDFLRLGTQMTISQKEKIKSTDNIPKENIYPVTLQKTDAVQAIKVILANSAVSRNKVFPFLPDIDFQAKEYLLHYLPFTKTSHELKQVSLGVTINQRVLEYGRSL